jgi:endo-1,4-beta-xylanase
MSKPIVDSASSVSRRAVLQSIAKLSAGLALRAHAQHTQPIGPDISALKRAALKSGKLLGMYTVMHELLFDPVASATIANTFSMIADGNDLKFSNRLRPTPTTYDFSYGDTVVSWAEQHGLLFRGHCLVWWNALPKWFSTYVTPQNARQVMTDHITNVVKHYSGRVYSWDVVNEPIYHDTPEGLRRKPWVAFIGPEYIDLAFHTAAAADPKAKLIVNECFIEHNTSNEITRRAQLLALVARLKKAKVPITGIGVQGHLRGNTPLDQPGMITFCKQVKDLGLEIMITEFDVDDIDIPAPRASQAVADRYAEFIDLMAPYVKVITFEQLKDEPTLPKGADGLALRPNLLDARYQTSPAYAAVLEEIRRLPSTSKRHT